jgi:hypothetical protein
MYLEVALEDIFQCCVHLPIPHFVKNRSNAKLKVRSSLVMNAGYGTPENFPEKEKNIYGISEVRF